MNKQGVGKIEYLDYTWNPITGCYHACKDEYCYANTIATRFAMKEYKCGNCVICSDCIGGRGKTFNICPESRYIQAEKIHELDLPKYTFYPKKRMQPYPFGFEPTFHKYRLSEPIKVKKPSIIGVVYMGDLFGEWVPDSWIEEVFKACEAAPWHKYIFLTKNYLKASKFKYHDNWWIGKTITNKENADLCHGDPWNIDGIHRANQFLSIEPLQGEISDLKYYLYSFKWVIIGAQTGPGAKPPKPEWVQSIIDQDRNDKVPIFMKNNLKPFRNGDFIQQFPDGLK